MARDVTLVKRELDAALERVNALKTELVEGSASGAKLGILIGQWQTGAIVRILEDVPGKGTVHYGIWRADNPDKTIADKDIAENNHYWNMRRDTFTYLAKPAK